METSKEDIEKRHENVMKELYSWDAAERARNATISEETRATLYLKGKIQDIVSALYSVHEMFYTEVDAKTSNEFYEATSKLNELADKYIIISITDQMGDIGFREI